MSEPRPPHRHLDASHGREVVYCHACQNEWYRDERPSLECPRCHGEITEIVSPENDPRELDDGPHVGFGPQLHDHHHDPDSDPEEADIDQQIYRTGNLFFMQRTFRPGGAANHDDPQVDVLRRFTDMLNDFHPAPPPQAAQAGSPPQMPGGDTPNEAPRGPSPMPAFTRSAFIASPFGPARVTVHTIAGAPDVPGGLRGFDAVFANLMNGPPGADDPNYPPARQGQPNNPLEHMIQGLMAVLVGGAPGGVHGDAVYSQEALDRIITQLMEAQPHSSRAPPPASEEAIAKLGKRNVQIEDLGPDGKVDCTICIEELRVGDEVTVLPCKHSFHGDCVTLWLKEHNTCPICRTPIEADRRQSRQDGSQPQGQQQGQQSDRQPGQQTGQQEEGRQQGQQAPMYQQYSSGQGAQDPSAQPGTSSARASRYERLFRSPGSTEERLNAIRNVAGANYRPSPSRQPSSSQQQQQQSGVTQRRSSYSPPPEQATRSPRVRSPELRPRNPYEEQQYISGYDADGYRRRERGSESGREGDGRGNGPLNWLRDQWSRHSGNGGGGNNGSGSGGPPGSGDRRS